MISPPPIRAESLLLTEARAGLCLSPRPCVLGAPTAAAHRATILVVDDHAPIRGLFADSLTSMGHRVVEAEGPRQAQRLAGEEPRVELLLSDFRMPEMNGAQLAEWFHLKFPLSKVLLVSGAPWEIEAYILPSDWLAVLAKTNAFARLGEVIQSLLVNREPPRGHHELVCHA